jgi:hypothetical protein
MGCSETIRKQWPMSLFKAPQSHIHAAASGDHALDTWELRIRPEQGLAAQPSNSSIDFNACRSAAVSAAS